MTKRGVAQPGTEPRPGTPSMGPGRISTRSAGECVDGMRDAAPDVRNARDAGPSPSRIYDLHCHLSFFANPAAAAHELEAAGVAALSATISPGDYDRTSAALTDAPNVRVGAGLHPWWVADGTCGEADIARAAELARASRYVAEVGLDFARGRDASAAAQLDALDHVLDSCRGGSHVLSLHAVRAGAPLLDLLERHGTCKGNRVILHWFSGTSDELRRALRLGCLFSIGPRMLATRRGREYARQLPVGRILLETDLPGSTAQGRELTPAELARQLRQAEATLCDLHGPDTARIIAQTSAELLQM